MSKLLVADDGFAITAVVSLEIAAKEAR